MPNLLSYRFINFIFLILPYYGLSQAMGIIKSGRDGEVLPGVTVKNMETRLINLSDMGGNFQIRGNPGDTLVFSSAGYLTDTLLITKSMIGKQIVLILYPKLESLPQMIVSEESKYRADSIQRHQDYAYLLNKKHPVKLWNEKRPGDEPGFSFSPIGYFSKNEKAKRKLKARLKEQDEQEYIDTKFSQSRVSFLTKLKGDSLHLFMTRFRPSYPYCRKANDEQMVLYINDKLTQFKQRKKGK